MSADTFRDRHVLITGGMGFIGSNLAHRLVECGAHVMLVDALLPCGGANAYNVAGLKGRVQFEQCDLRDGDHLAPLLAGRDFIFNLAGLTSHQDSMDRPHDDLAGNCTAQLTLLEACRRCCPEAKIAFASTRQIYGRPRYLPVDEAHPLLPADVNGVHKITGEWYHVLYHNVYGLRTTMLRLTNTIGPRMRVKDARQTFLGIWVRRLVQGQPFEVWGGTQLRDFTYVDDAVDAFLRAAASDAGDGRVYNLGGDPPISLKDLAELLIELNGRGIYVQREYPAERLRIDIGHYYANYNRAREELGWEPRVSLRQALARTLRYYHEHLAHYL